MPLLAAVVMLAAEVLGQPILPTPAPIASQGTIVVVQSGVSDSTPITAFEDAVARSVSDSGFTLLPDGAHARFVATTKIDRRAQGLARTTGKRPKASTGGGMTFGNGAGMGIQVPFGSAVFLDQLIATELTLRIAPRSGAAPAWEGRAITYQVAGSRGDDPAILGKRLSDAILRNLNGPSGVLTSVP